LLEAALDLFVERGFDATTVGDVAARAGLTERTFYRHFADKREVLFAGQGHLEEVVRATIESAPPASGWLSTGEDALLALEDFFSAERRAYSRRRQSAIDADDELREREQLKMAALAEVATAAFETRGTSSAVARLAGETTVALFKVAFIAWVAPGEERPFADLVRDAVAGLRAA
jgi:AcrR family transcriptional regulator